MNPMKLQHRQTWIFMRSFKSISLGGAAILALTIAGCGGGSGSSTTQTSPPVSATNSAPVVTSSSTASILENSTAVFYTLSATDADNDSLSTVEIVTSTDGAFFTIDTQNLQLSPSALLDFEQANDEDADNIYDIDIRVTDSRGASSTFSLAITIEDVSDNFSYGLQAGLPPSGNFELLDWKIDLPVNDSGDLEGDSATIDEDDMAAGYTNSEYFFTAADGGMVLRAPSRGAKTSVNTRYTRTELREMLRRGDRSISTRGVGDRPNGNNWAFSSAPQSALDDAGGIDGELTVTLAVNEVTTTGEDFQIGRVVIGQIHAKDDEPLRLYYRKLPDNRRGSIYAAHEINGGDDVYYEIIGSRSNSASNPSDGILLGETFTYNVNVVGNSMDVTITKANGDVFSENIDMTNSGYDIEDDFMYFKVGTYHLNDTADDGEFAQITVYELENKHQGYPF